MSAVTDHDGMPFNNDVDDSARNITDHMSSDDRDILMMLQKRKKWPITNRTKKAKTLE